MTGLYMGYRYAENENERLQRFARLNADLVIRSKSDFNDFVELLFNGRHGDFTLSATYIPFFDEKYFTNAQSRRKTLRKWIKSTDAGKKNILLDIGHNYISRTRGVSSISGPLQKDMKESKLRAYYYEEDYKKIFKSDPKLAINLLGKSTDYEFDALTSQFQHWSDKRKTLTRLMCDIGRCEDGLYMVDQLETLTKVLVSTDAKLKVYNEVICYKSELNRIRGSIYLEMGDYENAQRVLNNALTSLMICKRSNDFEEILKNEEVEVCKLKIQAYVAQGNLKRSISYVKRISEVDEALGTVYESIIELLSGKEKKALERFTLMIEKGDHDHLISALENVQAYSKQKQMLDKAMKHVRLEIKRRKI